MLKKVFTICVGLACGAGASQSPEFTQQYLQRLGGWVDSYQDRVTRLDARANEFKMTREQYIEALQASDDPKVRKEATNIATWPVYLDRFTEMQHILQNGPVWMQPYRLLQSYGDPAFGPIVNATLKEYKPAAPLNTDGAIFGGGGFVAGVILSWIAAAILGAPFNIIRRRRERPKTLPNLVRHKLEPATTATQPAEDYSEMLEDTADDIEEPEAEEEAEDIEEPEVAEEVEDQKT